MYIFRFQLGFLRSERCSVQYCKVLYNVVQCCKVLYSAVQCCTVLYSAVQGNAGYTMVLDSGLWTYIIYNTSQLNLANKFGNLNSIKLNSNTLGLIMVACCTLGPGSHSNVVCRQCGRAGLYSPLS